MDISNMIIYNNNQLLALNKPAGIPVQSDKTGDKSLLDLAEIYCKHTVYLIHRIDRPVSGLVLFAKNKKALAAINQQLQEKKVSKQYLAILSEKLTPAKGTLTSYLIKNEKVNKSFIVDKSQSNAKEAILHYEYLKSSDKYHLYKIQIETGRHHQIRVQLQDQKVHIKGDVKYGFRRANKDRSIDLHAWKLSFKHPISDEQVDLVAPPQDNPIWNFMMEGL